MPPAIPSASPRPPGGEGRRLWAVAFAGFSPSWASIDPAAPAHAGAALPRRQGHREPHAHRGHPGGGPGRAPGGIGGGPPGPQAGHGLVRQPPGPGHPPGRHGHGPAIPDFLALPPGAVHARRLRGDGGLRAGGMGRGRRGQGHGHLRHRHRPGRLFGADDHGAGGVLVELALGLRGHRGPGRPGSLGAAGLAPRERHFKARPRRDRSSPAWPGTCATPASWRPSPRASACCSPWWPPSPT